MDKLLKTAGSGLRSPLLVAMTAALICSAARAQVSDYEIGGHIKTRLLADTFASDSIFSQIGGSSTLDIESDLRLNFSADSGPWSFDADWQLLVAFGDRTELAGSRSGVIVQGVGVPLSDDRRSMNLTDTIADGGKFRALHRFDRLSIGYASDNVVIRIGRQAITWGNGLIFSPMDIVNPFDPTAIDTEYKAGDDMIYGQFSLANGDDIQFAHVFRRSKVPGESDSAAATTAAKYHGILGDAEVDILVSRNRDEMTLGVGGNKNLGGALWRGDILVTDTLSGNRVQLVTNLSYSWTWGGRNLSGVVEYYFSGFGQRTSQYNLESIAGNTGLSRRLERGEVFTVGRNYLATGVMFEMSQLWTLTPNLFANLDDGSTLLQFTTRYSLSDDAEILAALNVPLGAPGTEFGGLDAGQNGLYFSVDLSLFVQLAWYF
jgi:hypothetical protein